MSNNDLSIHPTTTTNNTAKVESVSSSFPDDDSSNNKLIHSQNNHHHQQDNENTKPTLNTTTTTTENQSLSSSLLVMLPQQTEGGELNLVHNNSSPINNNNNSTTTTTVLDNNSNYHVPTETLHHHHQEEEESNNLNGTIRNKDESVSQLSTTTTTTTTSYRKPTLTITSSLPTPPSEISVLNQVVLSSGSLSYSEENAITLTNANNNTNNNSAIGEGLQMESIRSSSNVDPYDLGITSSGRRIRDSLIICSAPTTSSTTLPFSTLSLSIQSNKRSSSSSTTSGGGGGVNNGNGSGSGGVNNSNNTNGAMTNRKKEKHNATPSIVTSTQQVIVNVTPTNSDPKYELITLLHRLISEHQLEKLEKILREERKKVSCEVEAMLVSNETEETNEKQSPKHSRTSSSSSSNGTNSSVNSTNQSGSEILNGLVSSTNVEPKKQETSLSEKFDIDTDFISEQTGRTLLMTAVAHENIKIIRLLHKEFNANLEFRDKRGRTAVFYACNASPHRTAMILQYLIGEGANVNLKDNEDNSPFYLCMESQNFQAATVLFVDGKADVNTQVGPGKNTAIHIAIKKDLITSVHFLVKRCMCDLTIPNARGETPIFLSLQHPAILNQILMDLTDKKVNTEVLDVNNYKLKSIEIEDENKNNCLHICAEFGYIDSIGEILSVLPEEIVRRLSSSQNKDGNTPLHVAVSHNHPELTFVLLFVNPDCAFFQNIDWDTPLHVALKQGNFKSAIILYPLSKYLDLENAEGQSIQYLVQLFGQELKQQEDTLKKLTEGEFYKPGSYQFETLLQDFSFISRMKDYLTASNQQDTITFFETVMEYQLVPTTSQRYEMAEKIVQQYLSDNSKVKFLKPKKEEFINKWKEYSKIFCPAYLFETSLDLALDEMRQNLFPKFVSSKVFKKWVENKAKSDPTFYLRFLKRETTPQEVEKTDSASLNLFEETLQEEQENDLKNRKTCTKCGDVLIDMNDYLFSNSDFDKAIDQSMEFIGWSQLESDQTLGKAYISPKGAHIHLDSKKKHTAVKFTGHLEHSNHTVFNMWIDPEYLYMRDPSILTSKQIDTASSRHFFSVIYHDIYSMAWPNSNRDFLTAICCTYRANTNTYICLQKSVTHPKCPENSKQVRAKIKSFFIVERINDTRCKYTYQVVTDFGGFLGSDFYANMIKDRGNFFHLLLSRTVKARELSGKLKPNSGGFLESLDYSIAHSRVNNEQ